jgi:hypothetical protein
MRQAFTNYGRGWLRFDDDISTNSIILERQGKYQEPHSALEICKYGTGKAAS